MYVGPQAPCTKSKTKHKLSSTTPAKDAEAAAADAVTQARKLGLKPDSVLIYNMESYAGDAACARAVLTFLSAWTAKLHDLSYLSGVYGDISSTVSDLVAAHRTPGFVPPDHLDFARWDNVATLTDAAIPADQWAGRRRMKQYRGPHKETWGGVTINIDSNLADLAPAPETRTGDFTGNGWSDLLTVTASGALDLRAGNGTTLTTGGSAAAGAGWTRSIRPGDFNGDGRDDLIARETATGRLWLYPGTGSGLGARVDIGKGWAAMREITAIGDMDRDGRPDLVAVETSTGRLLLYPGKGTGLGAGSQLGVRDWNLLDELAGVGDVDGDGVGDLIARAKDTGMLRLYSGWRTMNSFRQVLPGGAGLRGLTGAGDFDRDGTIDLMATDAATGTLYRYPVRPGGLGFRYRSRRAWPASRCCRSSQPQPALAAGQVGRVQPFRDDAGAGPARGRPRSANSPPPAKYGGVCQLSPATASPSSRSRRSAYRTSSTVECPSSQSRSNARNCTGVRSAARRAARRVARWSAAGQQVRRRPGAVESDDLAVQHRLGRGERVAIARISGYHEVTSAPSASCSRTRPPETKASVRRPPQLISYPQSSSSGGQTRGRGWPASARRPRASAPSPARAGPSGGPSSRCRRSGRTRTGRWCGHRGR